MNQLKQYQDISTQNNIRSIQANLQKFLHEDKFYINTEKYTYTHTHAN